MRTLVIALSCIVAAVTPVGMAPGGATAAAPDAAHPYSDPIWYPLREPVRVSCIITNCDDPIYHGYPAIDLVGEEGDPIYAAGAGVFHIGGVAPGCVNGPATRGTWVWIDHGAAGSTRYHHLKDITATEGQLVTPSTQIGTLGSSGDVCGLDVSYLHMEFRTSNEDWVRHGIPEQLRACISGETVEFPDHFGFDHWDAVTPHVTHTPRSDNSCMPNSWSDTPERPGRATIERGVASLTVRPASRPSGIDAVRVRLELFHPSLDAFGKSLEQTISPTDSAVVFDDLLESRLYRALVSYHNDAGWSAWSPPVEATTGVMPVAPDFRDSDSTARTIGYKWHRGPNADADYRVRIRRAVGSSWGSWREVFVPAPDLHHRFRDLEMGTAYQVAVRAENEFGTSAWSTPRVITTLCPDGDCGAPSDVFVSVAPARLADSRDLPTIDGTHRNTGPRPGGSTWRIPVVGRAGVPAGARAAVLNVTVADATGPGFATVFPCGDRPRTSSVNYGPGSVDPNEVIAKLSDGGDVCVFTLTTAHVIIDVVGYAASAAYRPLQPARFADSRSEPTFDSRFRETGKRKGGSTWTVQIAGRGGVPATAGSAVVNVTATGATQHGFVTVFPCGERPEASSLNVSPGVTRPNELVARLSASGTLCLYTLTDVDLIVDVAGYLDDDTIGYAPIVPTRFADSRPEPTFDGQSRDTGLRAAGSVWPVRIEGRAGVGSAKAVMTNITVTDARGPGFLTVFPCGDRPNASVVNYRLGTTRPNETLAQLSPDGTICIFTLSAAHIVVDVVGFTY